MTEESNNNNSQIGEKDTEKLPTEKETIKEYDAKIKQLEKEKGEYLSGWKRAKSDLMNYKKETDEKMQKFVLYANSQIIFDLVSIIDSFDLAINSLSEKDKETSLGKGYYLIQTQLLDVLRKYGLEMIDIKIQKTKFNPNFHEAVSAKICDKKNCDKIDDEMIIEVLSKGYLLHGQLLRPAKVRTITH